LTIPETPSMSDMISTRMQAPTIAIAIAPVARRGAGKIARSLQTSAQRPRSRYMPEICLTFNDTGR